MATVSLFTYLRYAVILLLLRDASGQYEPNWESIDSRPLPAWYDQAKFGIFINWGLYSVPSFGSEWFWWYWKGTSPNPAYVKFMEQNFPPGFSYADFAPMFKAEFYDPNQWADILQASGARYIVVSSKHHEGYTMWPSPVSWNWNVMDTGPHRDLTGDLATAIRNKTDLHFGLYHSLFEWFNPIYLKDKAAGFKTQNFVRQKTLQELYEIVNAYKPDVIWSDGDWEAPDVYWNSTEFLAWLYNDSPVKDTVVTNDRWGKGVMCHHGGYYTCSDRYNPGVLQKHKWENCMTIDRASWGYRRNAQLADYLTMYDLTKLLAETISCGGNLLMNIGPTADGLILPVYEERLRQMGAWLKVNGEAVYSSMPWSHQNDTVTPNVWYTSKKSTQGTSVYAFILAWPKGSQLELGAPITTKQTTVTLLGYQGTFSWQARPGGGVTVNIPPIPASAMPCQWAWVFKLDNLA